MGYLLSAEVLLKVMVVVRQTQAAISSTLDLEHQEIGQR